MTIDITFGKMKQIIRELRVDKTYGKEFIWLEDQYDKLIINNNLEDSDQEFSYAMLFINPLTKKEYTVSKLYEEDCALLYQIILLKFFSIIAILTLYSALLQKDERVTNINSKEWDTTSIIKLSLTHGRQLQIIPYVEQDAIDKNDYLATRLFISEVDNKGTDCGGFNTTLDKLTINFVKAKIDEIP